jgi:hypothetical protein
MTFPKVLRGQNCHRQFDAADNAPTFDSFFGKLVAKKNKNKIPLRLCFLRLKKNVCGYVSMLSLVVFQPFQLFEFFDATVTQSRNEKKEKNKCVILSLSAIFIG